MSLERAQMDSEELWAEWAVSPAQQLGCGLLSSQSLPPPAALAPHSTLDLRAPALPPASEWGYVQSEHSGRHSVSLVVRTRHYSSLLVQDLRGPGEAGVGGLSLLPELISGTQSQLGTLRALVSSEGTWETETGL